MAARDLARTSPRPATALREILRCVALGDPVDLEAIATESAAPSGSPDQTDTDWQSLEDALSTGITPENAPPDLARIAIRDPARLAALLGTLPRAARLVAASHEDSLRALIQAHNQGFADRELVALEILWDALPREIAAETGSRASMWQFALLAACDILPIRGGIAGLARAAVAHLAPDAARRPSIVHHLAEALADSRPAHAPSAPALLLSGLRGLPGGGQTRAITDTDAEISLGLTRCGGLILLAPFLPMLFARLDLLEGQTFRSPETLRMARDALHTLAWGTLEVSDPRTDPLTTLLCAIPPEMHLPPPAPLACAENCDLVESLLRAAIGQWLALGHTSPAGLRTTFLQRDGILSEVAQGMRLEISPRAYDMLLDRLPWSYTLVKLPWMQIPVHVKWRDAS